jgi:GxxExxY protein
MALELEGLTGEINAAAFAVHNELGPGFLESIYEAAMALEFEAGNSPEDI